MCFSNVCDVLLRERMEERAREGGDLIMSQPQFNFAYHYYVFNSYLGLTP